MPITTEVASSIPVKHHKPNRNDKMRNQKKKIYQTFGTVTKWIRKIVVADTKYGYSLHNRHDRPPF